MHEDKLYAIAMQCAKLNNQGCSCECHLCQFNVYNYAADTKEASLLKANAYTDFHNRNEVEMKIRSAEATAAWTPVVILAMVTGLFIWGCASCKSCMKPDELRPAPTQEVEKTNRERIMEELDRIAYSHLTELEDQLRVLINLPNNPNNTLMILRILNKYGVDDMNGDGLINCIDYSLMFRRLYGNDARLMVNYNPKTGMNHMYIKLVYPEGRLVSVDPQGTTDKWLMKTIWGKQYDPAFSTDETNKYRKFIE